MKRSLGIFQKTISGTLLPVFLMLCLAPPVTAHSCGLENHGGLAQTAAAISPLAYSIDTSFNAMDNTFKIEKRRKESVSKVVVNSDNPAQIYYVEEKGAAGTLIMRYFYDEIETVTLLVATEKDAETQAPIYSRYYRYGLGPDYSLLLILEEGWVNSKAGTSAVLTPSQFYDYSPGQVKVRFFLKSGQLLRIDSSDGAKTRFIYSQSGRLLTIRTTRLDGSTEFYDQLLASAKTVNPLRPYLEDLDKFFAITNARGDEERRSGLKTPFINPGIRDPVQTPLADHLAFHASAWRLLDWLAASNPTRAGPLLVPLGGRLP